MSYATDGTYIPLSLDGATAHSKYYQVPLVVPTEENFKPFGRLVTDYDKEEVWLVTWPQKGRRPIMAGSGNRAGIIEGDFVHKWQPDGKVMGSNEAVGYPPYEIGRLAPGEPLANGRRSYVIAREANHHPDGGQVFFPLQPMAPFVALLAPPKEDVTPSDFVAFYFDGSSGLQIHPEVWHQPLYPALADEQTFRTKQGAVHACVTFDSLSEFGVYLKVPLLPELIATA